jgi:uncharacterized membrane protein
MGQKSRVFWSVLLIPLLAVAAVRVCLEGGTAFDGQAIWGSVAIYLVALVFTLPTYLLLRDRSHWATYTLAGAGVAVAMNAMSWIGMAFVQNNDDIVDAMLLPLIRGRELIYTDFVTVILGATSGFLFWVTSRSKGAIPLGIAPLSLVVRDGAMQSGIAPCRPKSTSGPPTIDVDVAGVGIEKLKFPGK